MNRLQIPGGTKRGRPRDETSGPAILEATLELVTEVGIAGLTMDAVARRAGVGKATIYRRWPSKEALMLDAWMSCVHTREVPDTGLLRTDLEELLSPAHHELPDEVMQRVFPQMIAAAKVNPDVADAYRAFITGRRQPLQTVLTRAVGRGELPDDADLSLIHDLLVAPLLYRWMISDGEIGQRVIDQIIDLVLAGVASPATRR